MKYVVFALFLLLHSCRTFHFPIWWDLKAETIGEVLEVEYMPETWFHYTYEVNGKRYIRDGMQAHRKMAVGSKYIVAYNPYNPKESALLYHRPVFLDDEEVGYTRGIVGSRISMFYHEVYKAEIIDLKFSFSVNNKDYRVNSNRIINDKGYKREEIENKMFRVKYWKENPKRCVILLDEPIYFER